MHVLGVYLHARAASRVDHRPEREERRADADVDALDRRHPRQQRLDELLGLGDRLVHLPVPGYERRARRIRAHTSASTPGSCLPSISSSDAPPPVDRCVTLSARPKRWSAAAESPPPTTVVPGAAAMASATARVPAANGSISNAPIGPFQKTVPAAPIVAAYFSAVRGPMSRPIHPSGTSTPSI